MEVIQFTQKLDFDTNCFLVVENNKALLIDTGFDIQEILTYLEDNKIQLLAVLLTHGHFDHVYNAKKFQELGFKIYIHSLDADKLNSDKNLGADFNVDLDHINADVLLEESNIKIDDFKVQVIHTPGHSKGSCCYIINDNFFTGDTIFEHGYGRTDFYDGSYKELRQSIRKIWTLKKNKNYAFFYGHD